MKKIFVVGSLNSDLVIHAPYMPVGGETLMGSDFATNNGGKGANQACACAKLGGDIYMCGCVGNDAFGEGLIDSLSKDGVHTDYIRKIDGVPTGVAVIVVTKGENRIILDSGANAHLTKKDIDLMLEKATQDDIYLTQLENPIPVIGYGLRRAKEKGLFVVLNPAPANVEIKEYLQYVDLITPNETELEILGGIDELSSYGIKTIITTLGSKGYEIYTQGETKRYSCIKVDVVDTTAAGDTASGGLCAMLSKGESLESAMAFGSRAASIACSRHGAQKSIPKLEEVSEWS
ncbi:MAG: ribokinase [Clostridia bacterium]|nr:ribokinase [Clostridia bacterium]